MYTKMLTSKIGGELVSFKLDGEERIHQGLDCVDENGKVYWKRHSPVLFPVVGKLKKNQTIINGRIYEMPQHGFARDFEFEPITKLDNFHSYVLKSNKITKNRYPYDFELYTTYRLDENKLTTIYKVINTGDVTLPFGIGGHPAFKIDQEDLKNGNFEDVKKYVDYSELTSIPGTGSQESDEDGEIPAEQAEKEKLLYEALEWNIKSTKKEGNVATIEIEVTNKDYKEIYKNYIQEVFSRLLTNENMSDEEGESYLIEQLRRDDIGMATTTQTITLEKQDENWIVKVDDNLKNLIYPGMQEAMNSISDFINAE